MTFIYPAQYKLNVGFFQPCLISFGSLSFLKIIEMMSLNNRQLLKRFPSSDSPRGGTLVQKSSVNGHWQMTNCIRKRPCAGPALVFHLMIAKTFKDFWLPWVIAFPYHNFPEKIPWYLQQLQQLQQQEQPLLLYPIQLEFDLQHLLAWLSN
jgi:hypothetical protein